MGIGTLLDVGFLLQKPFASLFLEMCIRDSKCTYFAVIDKLQKAKSVDPSVAEEANKLISTYAAHTPKDADLFLSLIHI